MSEPEPFEGHKHTENCQWFECRLERERDEAIARAQAAERELACKHFFSAERDPQTMADLGPGMFALCGHLEGSGLTELLEELKRARVAADALHAYALEEATELIRRNPPTKSAAGRRLMQLGALVEAYEKARWPT